MHTGHHYVQLNLQNIFSISDSNFVATVLSHYLIGTSWWNDGGWETQSNWRARKKGERKKDTKTSRSQSRTEYIPLFTLLLYKVIHQQIEEREVQRVLDKERKDQETQQMLELVSTRTHTHTIQYVHTMCMYCTYTYTCVLVDIWRGSSRKIGKIW